jgi:hypothetical protein
MDAPLSKHSALTLKTGDIVLFSGKSGFSRSIKWFTWSPWTHIGMILRIPQFSDPLIWESLRVPELPDAIDGTMKSGVQLLHYKDRVQACTCAVGIRSLNQPISDDMYNKLIEFRESVKNRPYESSFLELIRAAWDGPFGRNEENLESLFCSELIAEAYQTMGLLQCDKKGGAPSNEYTPKYFSEKGNLPLLGRWSLGPTRVIKDL